VGWQGRGESTRVGSLLYGVLAEFASLCDERGEAERAERYRREAARLAGMLERTWDGEWYRRGPSAAPAEPDRTGATPPAPRRRAARRRERVRPLRRDAGASATSSDVFIPSGSKRGVTSGPLVDRVSLFGL